LENNDNFVCLGCGKNLIFSHFCEACNCASSIGLKLLILIKRHPNHSLSDIKNISGISYPYQIKKILVEMEEKRLVKFSISDKGIDLIEEMKKRKLHRDRKPAAKKERICEECGKKFTSPNLYKKFCSNCTKWKRRFRRD